MKTVITGNYQIHYSTQNFQMTNLGYKFGCLILMLLLNNDDTVLSLFLEIILTMVKNYGQKQ